MFRVIGLAVLGLFIWACLVPVYSVLIMFPVTIVFGDAPWLYTVQIVLVYALSGLTALWLVRRINSHMKPDAKPPVRA